MSPSLPVNVPPPTAPARHPGPRPRCEPLTTFIMKALACGYVECHPSGHPHVTLAAPTFMMKPPDLHHESPELGFRRHPLHPSVTDQAVEDLAVMAEPTTTMLRNLPCRSQKHASARFRPIAWQTPNSLPAGPYVTPAHTRKIASASQERTSDVGVDGYTDATGLLYLINRYYDPVTGQFISVDPWVEMTGQPYQFVNADPVNFSDPNGLTAKCSGPGAPTEAQLSQCGDGPYTITGTPSPGYTNSGTAQFGTLFTTFAAIFGLCDGALGSVFGGGDSAGLSTLDINSLNDAQGANYARYVSKLPSGAGRTSITELSNGSVRFSSNVPGRVPGSFANYAKTVDAAGDTTGYVKTTYGPDGEVISVKNKFNP